MKSTYTFFARTVNAVLQQFGYQIQRLHSGDYSLQAALTRLSARPIVVNTIIDVGASDGRWSDDVLPFFPDAFFFLIEANPYHKSKLNTYKLSHPHVGYILAAAGDHEGEVYFDARDPFGGVASITPREGYMRVPVTTIDTQVQNQQLKPPFFLKLDTHGFEVPILEGASQTLKNTHMVLIETYNFQLQPDSLRFHEMVSLMETKGFRPIDLTAPRHRHRDKALWQFDLLFIRADRPEFQSNSFE